MKTHNRTDYWEVNLREGQWASIPSTQTIWESSTPAREQRLQTAEEIALLLHTLMLAVLTRRQRQVMELYYFENQTEVQVATALGITQPTVCQHIHGKIRNGRRVGGALRRIRKAIRRAAAKAHTDRRDARLFSALGKLLDENLTRHEMSRIMVALSETAPPA